ncbi:MAG TPA: carboxypeptidase-like regulatory domain-containing protein [Bryobacteraceae bacterium]|nr:carboxypeptidase-like regulatory domain-containing protein [Bryobacteraceae bacterium]
MTVSALLWGAACVLATGISPAASPVRLSGAISGIVVDGAGIPQMGATVVLYNRQDRLTEKVTTNDKGEFQFLSLFPDLYSVRVTLATFLPAVRQNILVQPGMRSVLNVNLSGLFSTIQISYPTLDNGSLITDDWKWVLRSAAATRPVLRFLDKATADQTLDVESTPAGTRRSAVFSDTRGILKVSAGEGGLLTGAGNEADLGTAFALATSVYGSNMVQVSGNVGYGSQTGIPTAAFRTSYSRNVLGETPEVSLTMRQLFVPSRLGPSLAGNESALPMLRTMSASFDDRSQVADNVTLQYGFTMDSVVFMDHLNYLSPYARLDYAMPDGGDLELAYTSGNARPDLAGQPAPDADLQRDLNSLAMFPNVSLLNGRPKIQRGEEYEITYSRKMGSRTWYVSAHRESVVNAALSMVAPGGQFLSGDILPDLFSDSAIFNAGNYQATGYTAAMTQNLGDHVTATVMYGSTGALTVDNQDLTTNSPDELRSMIRAGRRQAATGRVTATIPHLGTHMIASYQWTNDPRWALTGNPYSTQAIRQTPGLNVYIRQPIPNFAGLPWRMEATADMRNMLAQGYLPINTLGGPQMLLVETPRSFRGGLSFIF